jgi:transposase, IS30 family
MKAWKHFNLDQRKIIVHQLAKRYKLCVIADTLEVDPSAVSKEIKRNRVLTKPGRVADQGCKHLVRFPYCCNGCVKKYQGCLHNHYTYDALKAHGLAQRRLVDTRSGINMTPQQYKQLDATIKQGVDDGQSVYHIVHSHPELSVSVSSVYRLINNRQLTTRRMDLPYAVTYKKRKVLKAYEYKENSRIDRSHRTYVDFLAYKHQHPHQFHIQMDFLGSILTDKKSILTLTFPDLHYVMLFLVEAPTSEKIIHIFHQLELQLSTKIFAEVFPFILTDRDPCFSSFNALETSRICNQQRTRLFYCDSFNSCQKGNVEQMNKQLRKFFPKGKSIDAISDDDVKRINHIINHTRIASLSGAPPAEVFCSVFGHETLDILTHIVI